MMKSLEFQVQEMKRNMRRNHSHAPIRNVAPDWREGLSKEQRALLKAEVEWMRDKSDEDKARSAAQQVDCDTCGGMGVVTPANIPIDHPKFGKLVDCPHCVVGERRAVQVWENRIKTSGLPAHYLNLTFQSFDDLPDDLKSGKMQARFATEEFALNEGHYVNLSDIYDRLGAAWSQTRDPRPKNSLVLYGELGVGKTGLAAAIFNYLLARSDKALYIRAYDMIEEVKKDDRRSFDDESPATSALEAFQKAPVLLLDEANLSKTSAYRQQVMENVLRFRHGRHLPTIVTTNLNEDVFLDMWGDRCQVLMEMAHWVEMGGERLRRLA